ncbi:ATP synthase subunit I [Paenibacillus sp. MBLB4367]|uniref:ATP synthase subunit I n=1 Tax=Paenibacillus sp. MBLB4367 TaxID=3384767 RepID=UPI0039083D91
MIDLSTHLRTLLRATLFLMAAGLVGWALVPWIRPYAAGVMLGAVGSLVNAHLLRYKIEMLGQQLVEKTQKRVGLGFVARLSVSLIAVMVAIKQPGVDLPSTIVGLFFAQMVTLLLGIVTIFKRK